MTDNNKKTHLIVTGRGGGSGTQVQADWSQTDDTQVDYIKNKPTIPAAPVQSDWNEADSSSLAYINNKPTIPPQQWFGTQAEYDLIDPKDPNVIYNIEGSDNVQADWNQSDSSADDYIKNKPTIPAAPVQSNWNESDNTSLAYIQNKPTIPAAQVQSDWNQSDNTQADYIKNKPEIPSVPAMATQELTFTLEGGTKKTIEFYTVPNYFYVEDISGSDNTLMIKKASATAPDVEVFYSTDKANWTSMGTTSTTNITATIPANGKLYLKANANSWSDVGQSNRISTSGNHNIGGNIMSLLYGDNFTSKTEFPSGSNHNFNGLFMYNTKAINASKLELPATTLAQYCYANMFQSCSSLTTAPALPATTLANYCYKSMFQSCTSLTTAPELPATTLAFVCYQSMFESCTSLTTAPELPATTLANYCYDSIFHSCTSLTTAPALPATTLAEYCYQNMFESCTSLTTAPVLPATTLTYSCYSLMFNGCTNLNKVTTYASNISARNCLQIWLDNVSATGDFYNLGGATYSSGTSGIPEGWTEHTSL